MLTFLTIVVTLVDVVFASLVAGALILTGQAPIVALAWLLLG